MSKIIKYCPRCGYETDNELDNFCPVCVDIDEPIRLVEKPVKEEGPSSVGANDSIEANPQKVVGKVSSAAKGIVKEATDSPDISLGRANAIAGDVKVETHSTIRDITIVNEKKTQAEELTDKKRVFRAECKKYCIDGFISDTGLKKLEELRAELELDKDIASDILNEVKLLSKKVRTELPQAGRIKLEYATNAVERNDDRAISSAIIDLESWMDRVDVDELNQMYYQLLAIVHPGKYLDLVRNNTKEDYWKTYWAYVAYGIQGLQSEAEFSLAELTAWDSFYPTQNQSLLSVVGYLMRNEEDAARTAFANLTPGYSKVLAPIYDTLHELLETDWSNVTSRLSPRSKFYAKTLFGDFSRGIEQKQKEAETVKAINDANKLEEEARLRAEAEKLQFQKESFLVEYSESNGNVDKACQKAGITNATFNTWLSADCAFSDSFKNAKLAIERKKEEERQSIEEQKARDAENNRLKNEFLQLFESNDCDLLKTCAQTCIDSSTFRDWKYTDQIFADKVSYIQRVYEQKCRDRRRIQKKATVKKASPFIVIILLLGIICLGVSLHKNKVAKDKAEQVRKELTQQAVSKYNNRIVDFNQALDNANNSNIEALGIACEIFVDIRAMEATEDLSGKNESTTLRKAFNLKAESILRDLQFLVSESEQSGSSDPEGARILAQEENNLRSVKEYINIVAK